MKWKLPAAICQFFLEVRRNDQLKHGHRVVISRWPEDVCPVALVEELLKRDGHEGHVPLFGRIRIIRIIIIYIYIRKSQQTEIFLLGALNDYEDA